MSDKELVTLSEDELVGRFLAVAKEAGSAVLNSEVGKANRALHHMWAIEDVLRSRGRDARLALVPLLDDSDRFVRYYAAKHLLALVPGRSRQIVEETAKGFDALAGEAGMSIYFLDSGIYQPD